MISFDVKSLILIFLGIFIFKIAIADQMRDNRVENKIRKVRTIKKTSFLIIHSNQNQKS